MSELLSTRLNHLSVLSVTGKDAVKFLQGQCTQDVAGLPIGETAAGAFCTAKGRVVSNVWLFKRADDCIWLLCHVTSAPILQTHLTKYIAFFRGTVLKSEAENFIGYGVSEALFQKTVDSEELTDSAVAFKLTEQFRHIWLSTSDENQTISELLKQHEEQDASRWQALETKQKLLWLDDKQVEQWIPQNISLDEMDGISFKKGCYTGQEVIARLHYKGQSKKRLYALAWSEQQDSTDKIYAQGKAIGELVQQAKTDQGYFGLAVLKTDSLDQPIYQDENQQFQIELLD